LAQRLFWYSRVLKTMDLNAHGAALALDRLVGTEEAVMHSES
jgi:hypothetical protein